MVRSAAKNWKDVAVLTDASQYAGCARRIEARRQGRRGDTRFALAVAAFNRISNYDAAISDYLSSLRPDGSRGEFPAQSNGRFVKLQDLRYGENPHQSAAFYRDLHPAPGSLVMAKQLQGKELSYNNIADADAAWECVKSFDVVRRLRDRQARQPLRRRDCRQRRRGLREGLQDRPDLGFRRHHRLQRPGRRRGGAVGGQAVRRGAACPGLQRRGAQDLRREGQHARAADPPRRLRRAAGRHGSGAAMRTT